MFSPAKTIGVLLVSLTLAAALLTLPTEDSLPRQMKFIYNLFYSIVFGWAFYVPFVAAYAAAARRWPLQAWSALLLGMAMAAVATAPLWASPSFPAFSGVRFFDSLGWAVGGACYALLHHVWIAPAASRGQVRDEASKID